MGLDLDRLPSTPLRTGRRTGEIARSFKIQMIKRELIRIIREIRGSNLRVIRGSNPPPPLKLPPTLKLWRTRRRTGPHPGLLRPLVADRA